VFSFNSLFEIPRSPWSSRRAFRWIFNSLFEIRWKEICHVHAARPELSILFLRFLFRGSGEPRLPCRLSILFLRFLLGGVMVDARLCFRRFQFSFWDSNSRWFFEVGWMKFSFQFSFWDSGRLRIRGWAGGEPKLSILFLRFAAQQARCASGYTRRTFNSLFEIPTGVYYDIATREYSFQFSFWDSMPRRPTRGSGHMAHGGSLSILFLRFVLKV